LRREEKRRGECEERGEEAGEVRKKEEEKWNRRGKKGVVPMISPLSRVFHVAPA